MKIPINNYDIPKEPGLYLVVWGGSDGQTEAIFISSPGQAWVIGDQEQVDLTKAPYNHPLTKFSERIEAE